ncbi:hypothetical protein [Sphingobium phenoxybenzoativorans]|uniref:hypothetical protein n=1 Tax=Sphingobium phenoxybenzoativorans TaxID=1592790 RepID=UPI00209B14AB|nr:hypothetical protein [Sphingobium phenoxybenzoativorans]
MPDQPLENENLAPKPADDQDHALTDEEKLEEGLHDSMDASDPPSVTKPGDHGDPVPSSGFSEDDEGSSRGQRPSEGTGPVYGSGADAGGTSTSDEDYDTDAAGGGERPNYRPPAERHPSAEDIIVDPKKGGGF